MPIISNFDFWQEIFTFVPPSSVSIVIKSLLNLETISFNFLAGRVILPASTIWASTVVITVKTKSVAVKRNLLFYKVSIKILYKTGWTAFWEVALSTILIPLYKSSLLITNFIP